ncbi:unnamed protein product [Withania somnifera]
MELLHLSAVISVLVPINTVISFRTRKNKKKVFIRAKATEILSSPAKVNESFTAASPVETPSAPLLQVSPNSLQCEPGYLIPNSPVLGSGGLIGYEYLTNILSSKVCDVAYETPLQVAPKLSERLGVKVWLKREDLQPVFSFKIRGAYNMMAKLSKEQLEKGVICSSAGNHAQGVALSAQRLGYNAVIAMPVTTPDIKRAESEGRTFIPPFDHPDVIIGQGTVGMEINRQLKDNIHAVFVPVGGGGLIAGIAAYLKSKLDQVGGFADGVAVKVVGEETYRLCKELIDGVVLVGRDAICASIKDMFEEKRSILEPAGALALAGVKAYCKYYGLKDENVVAITSGANMNFDRLRLVTELTDVGRQREAVLATFIPEDPGSFKKFAEIVGPMNITEFKYRYNSDKERALVLYSVGLHTKLKLEEMLERMKSEDLQTINLTDNDLVKDHLRHLMGGRTNVHNELLCRFIFPETPGALMKFLEAFSPRWNISLFHYRAQGDTGANVLVGIQVPQDEVDEFQGWADNLGYEYAVESLNEAF